MAFKIIKKDVPVKTAGAVWQSTVGAVVILVTGKKVFHSVRLLEQQKFFNGKSVFIGPHETLMPDEDFGVFVGMMDDKDFLTILRADRLDMWNLELAAADNEMFERTKRVMDRCAEAVHAHRVSSR